MIPIFKRKKKKPNPQGNCVSFQAWRSHGFWANPNSPDTSGTKYRVAASTFLWWYQNFSITFKVWSQMCTPLETRQTIGAGCWPGSHQQLMEPVPSTAHPQQGSASVHTHKAASRDKVSKTRVWLCNYLFSYNCRFSRIIRLINIKFFLVLPRIPNDAVRSQKEGK